MANFRHDLSQLMNEVAELRAQLDTERKERKHQFWQVVWKLRRFRAAIIRLEQGVSGERWHVGREYTRGTRLLLPGKPRILVERLKLERGANGKRPASPDAKRDLLSDEDICNGVRNGIPTSIGPDAPADPSCAESDTG
jgi:hypothetical protein